MKAWLRHAPALALALLSAAGCATSPDAPGAETLVGCWYFEQDEAARELRLPWGIRLSERPLEAWPALQRLEDVRLATTLTREGEHDYPFGYWRPVAAGDSLHIGYPAGGGLAVEAAVRPLEGAPWPVLEGTVRERGDVLPAEGTRPAPRRVRLTYAQCP